MERGVNTIENRTETKHLSSTWTAKPPMAWQFESDSNAKVELLICTRVCSRPAEQPFPTEQLWKNKNSQDTYNWRNCEQLVCEGWPIITSGQSSDQSICFITNILTHTKRAYLNKHRTNIKSVLNIFFENDTSVWSKVRWIYNFLSIRIRIRLWDIRFETKWKRKRNESNESNQTTGKDTYAGAGPSRTSTPSFVSLCFAFVWFRSIENSADPKHLNLIRTAEIPKGPAIQLNPNAEKKLNSIGTVKPSRAWQFESNSNASFRRRFRSFNSNQGNKNETKTKKDLNVTNDHGNLRVGCQAPPRWCLHPAVLLTIFLGSLLRFQLPGPSGPGREAGSSFCRRFPFAFVLVSLVFLLFSFSVCSRFVVIFFHSRIVFVFASFFDLKAITSGDRLV